MNLGQSQFQDTFFVAQAQLTPYRQLRQIELELRQIEDALMRNSFNERKLKLKLEELDPSKPKQAIKIDEINWDLKQQEQLKQDALARQENFLALKAELLANVPQEYWDAGYEAAEAEHWVHHFARQMAFETFATGRPSIQTMQQVSLLPPEFQRQIHIGCEQNKLLLGAPTHVEVDALPSPSKDVDPDLK